MKAILILLVLVLLGYASIQAGTVFRNKGTMAGRVEHWLDFVDENSFDTVKQGLVADAKKYDLTLDPAQIDITYTDVDRAVGPQKFVEKLATFKNKQVVIHIRYNDSVLGFQWPQDITKSKIKQIEVRQKVRPEYDELLQ
jgi:hypothetical protein